MLIGPGSSPIWTGRRFVWKGTPEWYNTRPRCPASCLIDHLTCPPFCVTMGGTSSKPEMEQVNANSRLDLTQISVHAPTTLYTVMLLGLVVAVATLVWVCMRRLGWCSVPRAQTMNNYRRRFSEAALRPLEMMRMRDALALEMVAQPRPPTAVLAASTTSGKESPPYSPQY